MDGDSHIPYSTISIIVNRTCAAIYEVLHEKYLRTPNNKKEWKLIADRFLEKWQLPHCLEHAIDSVKAAVCLHNFLIDEMPQNGNPKNLADTGDSSDGKWRQQGSRLDKAQMVPRGANRATETAKDIRGNLKNWFSNAGAVV
ncbi:hypothetical protein DdX_09640 [Ditylenchus destructor]|uniref:DDE Tnp4 domain-containing protein n=1 Tax=Ditylenchus destructor TaxID=166010 RepID=A0AAD4N3M0_9BILA|nr:hypothetical protein DdX_09640 [Ditylenchus destructor]